MTLDDLKQQAADQAVAQIQSGMTVGLGHGSTAIKAVRRLAELLNAGALRDIRAIACSKFIDQEARSLGIPMTDFEHHPVLDLTIDGADEVDPACNLIKGGGGALVREKVVAVSSRREIIIVDETKLSPRLGTKWAVPVEILPFACRPVSEYCASLGADVIVRKTADGTPFITDQSNWIIDCRFGPIADPARLAQQLDARTGILDHGLFIGIASEVIIAGEGGLRTIKP